jgi:chromosome segregation ATPase
MDPLSILVSAVTLTGVITSTVAQIKSFVKRFRESRAELDAIRRELASISTVIDILQDEDEAEAAKIPSSLREQVVGILNNCSVVVRRIEETLTRLGDRTVLQRFKWTVEGKQEVEQCKLSLEAHKSALNIALDTMTWYAFPAFAPLSASHLTLKLTGP